MNTIEINGKFYKPVPVEDLLVEGKYCDHCDLSDTYEGCNSAECVTFDGGREIEFVFKAVDGTD